MDGVNSRHIDELHMQLYLQISLTATIHHRLYAI